MRVEFISHIDAIEPALWNSITGTDYPFTRFEFLHALENSGAVCKQMGWEPQHVAVYSDDCLVAVMPLYLKHHSYGEYVFDWSWADAYRRHGVAYYPKLLCAIPYTPATGQRLCIRSGEDDKAITALIMEAINDHAERLGASSIHILFPSTEVKDQLNTLGFTPRQGAQYHWFNHSFNNFDDFLASFSSRKRKNLRKERLRVIEQGLELEIIEGNNISAELWQTFFHFYQLTYAKRSGHGGYLEQSFFEQVAASMPEQLVLVMAKHEGQYIAGALNFRDQKTLYGRYWGCIKEFDFLHFEACYYQGIEYCIANGLQRFDPGAQGEHKIQRGFEPVATWSNHRILHPAFSSAIDDFLEQESTASQRYIEQARQMLPFKKS
jgi:predicted N-acyltransferase